MFSPFRVSSFFHAQFIPTVVSQPTLLFLTSGGPTWSRQDCLNRNITTLSVDRGALTPREQSLNADTLRQNAQASPFLEQFTFLRDPDGALLSRRFATLAPMAQVRFNSPLLPQLLCDRVPVCHVS
jgi:hypothetical protein